MNTTPTQIPQGDVRKPTKRLNWKWLVARALPVLVFGSADAVWCRWAFRVVDVSRTYGPNGSVLTIYEHVDEYSRGLWMAMNFGVSGFAVVMLVITVSVDWWNEPRWKP